ncbi:MAG TPA: rhomboid family intramembrane serine protease [Chthoniobacter sp.]|nr:rhomboid family intramembrane serine protease [Chthoniobacter sp.]
MSDETDRDLPMIEAGRYAKLAAARERGLVVAALGRPYEIKREARAWVLLVEEESIEAVRQELAAFESEEKERPPARTLLPAGKFATFPLFLGGWVLATFFLVQQLAGKHWLEQGSAEGQAILQGEWWRTITALTLHADGPHVTANLATGLLFAAFVIPRLGGGLGWLAILASGALGNALNAWTYRNDSHDSIGASTACFGALGILVGAELYARWSEPHQRNTWQLIVPIGAGLGLLAYLGVGEEGKNIDYMAHGWGFAVGLLEGILAMALHLKERLPRAAQRAAGFATLALLPVCWFLAMRR